MNNIGLQLSAAKIKRYHTAFIIGEQTVGEHSYGVAQLVRHFTNDNWSKQLMMAALDHDILEFHTGDIPHPTKVNYPELQYYLDVIEAELKETYTLEYSLTAEDEVILKCADLMEMAQFGLHQFKLGNRYGLMIIKAVETAILQLDNGKVPQQVRDMLVEIFRDS